MAAADAGRLAERALADPHVTSALHDAVRVHALAVGKAARPMLTAFVASAATEVRTRLAISPSDAGHPVPDVRSTEAATRALELATSLGERDLLVVLLSGGASALMALPVEDLSLAAKQETIRTIMSAGGDIAELNTVRKHLSRVKGGRLAAACRGSVLTLAISDVVGNDLAVIGSGPTVPDPTTWQMAREVIERRDGRGAYPADLVRLLNEGVAGRIAETPKPGDARLARSRARVIGGARDAVEGARAAAESAGYHVRVIETPVVGDARQAGLLLAEQFAAIAATAPRPLCVLSAGETTVRVIGSGRGGRNQEVAISFAMATSGLAHSALGSGGQRRWAFGSIGTDGIDGPTDAAGAIVDSTTLERARAAGLAGPARYLDDNDSYTFFDALDDLVRTGPTNTNVGDLQVALIDDFAGTEVPAYDEDRT